MFDQMMMAYYVPDPGAAADWYRDKLGLRSPPP